MLINREVRGRENYTESNSSPFHGRKRSFVSYICTAITEILSICVNDFDNQCQWNNDTFILLQSYFAVQSIEIVRTINAE